MWRPRRAGLPEVLWRPRQGEVTVRAVAVAAVKARQPVVAAMALEPAAAAAVVALQRHRRDQCCRRTAVSRQR